MGDVELERRQQHDAGIVGDRAHTGAAIGHVRLVLLGIGDELLEVRHRQTCLGDQQQRRRPGEADRLEAGQRVVGQLLEQGGVGDVRADRAEPDRVAVGRGVRELGQSDRAAGAADVLDHHGLLEVRRHALRHRAGQRVAGTAGRERHDQGERLGGKALGGSRAGRQQERRESEQKSAQDHDKRPSSQGRRSSSVGRSRAAGGAPSGRARPTRLCQ